MHPEEEKQSESGANRSSAKKLRRITVFVVSILIVILLTFLYVFGRNSGYLTAEPAEANLNTNTKITEIPKKGVYDCIESVNCMPIVPKERSWVCSGDYINWATANCTNFQVFR